MAFNFTNTVELKTVSSLENFKYLGSYIISTENDFDISKALSMVRMPQKENGLEIQPLQKIESQVFKSNVEAVLLYGCEACIVDKALTKKMLQMLWMLHMYAAHGTEYLKKAETY